ncbi:hypothetical protein P3T24_007629 [Paraburkholderia sp. GAS33]|uniref:Uncharacterized protein n=1 Tax=Paraburkholderia phenazinium TaxID=60549 RepID=A0A1N6JZS5_9BURK|nr:hypothetical protein SAMN05444168_5584 [Paraburkholderia phenazinium]
MFLYSLWLKSHFRYATTFIIAIFNIDTVFAANGIRVITPGTNEDTFSGFRITARTSHPFTRVDRAPPPLT